MGSTIFMGIGMVIGVMILGTGLYYFVKEKADKESRKIYGAACIAGLAIVVGILIKAAIA